MNRFLETFEQHAGKVFWTVFALAGLLVILASNGNWMVLYTALGFSFIALGLHRLGEEIAKRRINRDFDRLLLAVDQRVSEAEDLHDKLRVQQNYRFFHLDRKRAGIEQRLEYELRLLTAKILELENRLNQLRKDLKV
ncbi:MAG: hypothetical protein DRP12_00910 [Candidatus Aenigmatarchaeota archaeon]|nr:MAG: hypothetical protein DRP12_00910 [Candidatus Aenigmarchaeota archaeon]